MLILVPLLLLVALRYPSPTTFSLRARTEVLEISAGERPMPRWFLRNGRVQIDDSAARSFSGGIAVAPGAEIRFERSGQRPLFVHIHRGTGARAAELFNPSQERTGEAEQRLVVEVEGSADRPLVLSLLGNARVGDVLSSQTREDAPMLIEGEVGMLWERLVGSGRYRAGSAELDPGSRFEVLRDDGRASTGFGFVRVDGRPGMAALYHARGAEGRVDRFGSRGYSVRPSIWSRFANEPLIQALIALYAGLLPTVNVWLSSKTIAR